MYKDYQNYITRIRDNLIQCGVSLPYSITGDLSKPEELFNVCSLIDDILYYYRIMSIGGSEHALQGFFLPLNGYYKDKMRELAYQDFSELLEDYEKLLGVDSSSAVDIGFNPNTWDDDDDEESEDSDENWSGAENNSSSGGGIKGNTPNEQWQDTDNPLKTNGQTVVDGNGPIQVSTYDSEYKTEEEESSSDNSIRTTGVMEEQVNDGAERVDKEERGDQKEGTSISRVLQHTSPFMAKVQANISQSETMGMQNNSEDRYGEGQAEYSKGRGVYQENNQDAQKNQVEGLSDEDFANAFFSSSGEDEESYSKEDSENVIKPLHSQNAENKSIFSGVFSPRGTRPEVVEYAESGTFLEDEEDEPEVANEGLEYVEEGTFLDDEEDEEYIPSGTYLEDDEEEYSESGTFLDDDSGESEYTSNGTYLEDIEDDFDDGLEVIDPSELLDGFDELEESDDGIEYVNEEEYEDDLDSDFDEPELDENGFEVVEEEESWADSEEFEDEPEDVKYDENGFEIVDEEDTWSDSEEFEEDESEGPELDENGFEIVEEETWSDSDDLEDDEKSSDDDGIEYVEDDEPEFDDDDQVATTAPIITPHPVEQTETDLSDTLTKGVNTVLTELKKSFVRSKKKWFG